MLIKGSVPSADGYRMPAEFEPHRGCIMIWPDRPGSWPFGAKAAKRAFAEVAAGIAKSEKVFMLAEKRLCGEAAEYVPAAEIVPIPTDDAWARDVCPTFVVKDTGTKESDTGDNCADEKDPADLRGISWRFNAWGGEYDGLYAHWEQDDACAGRVCEYLGVPCYDAGDFVLEGGSIHSDGEGTVLVTEACLLSPGRNPQLSKEQIEEKLQQYLGAKKIIWLPHGIYGDETNEHVDNVCAFVRPGEVVLAWPEEASEAAKTDRSEKSGVNVKTGWVEELHGRAEERKEPEKEKCRNGRKSTENEMYEMQVKYSLACLEVLESQRDAMGRKIRVHKLPLPRHPVCISREDLPGFTAEEGEAGRFEGEQLAASYVNFYIANRSVIVPQFHDENDRVAAEILAKLFPEREIVPVYARDILMGGGNIHCITQQIP